jgi:hypothetical protein
MRFTVKKMDEIKKSLNMIEQNLLNAYVKVGTKKLFVHKNTLYTDPNFVKIAGHFQDGMAMLKDKKKSKLIRSKSKTTARKSSKKIFMNSNNSRRGMYNSNKEILSEPEVESMPLENGNGNNNRNGNRNNNRNNNRNGNGNGNKTRNNSFEPPETSETVEPEPESPVQSEESEASEAPMNNSPSNASPNVTPNVSPNATPNVNEVESGESNTSRETVSP